MYQLELACRTQVDAMAARTDLVMPSRDVLAAMLRLLEAEQKNSAFPPYWQ